MGRVEWRGVALDERSRDMMVEVARLASFYLQPSQGSWSGAQASAGTHLGAGAVDVAAVELTPDQRQECVRLMRMVGWAAWLRTPQQSNWPYHIHGIAVGCEGVAASAAAQVQDYVEGRNGLANRGRDDGPRDWVGMTWERYQSQRKKVAMADAWFMLGPDGKIWCVAADCSSKFHLPTPEVAKDVGWIIRSGGSKVLTPPEGAQRGDIGGYPVWEGVRTETLAAIPQ